MGEVGERWPPHPTGGVYVGGHVACGCGIGRRRGDIVGGFGVFGELVDGQHLELPQGGGRGEFCGGGGVDLGKLGFLTLKKELRCPSTLRNHCSNIHDPR